MRTRFLGVLLIALVVLGGLNLAQAIRSHFHHGPSIAKLPDLPPLPSLPGLSESDDIHVHVDVDHHDGSSAGEVMIERQFDVKPGEWLNVDVQHADVVVNTWSDDQAYIRISVDARNMSRAQEVFERMDFRVEQDGDRIVIRSDQPRSMNWRTRMRILVEASIPRSFNLELESTHGDVSLDNLEGDVVVSTTHGDVSAETLTGDRIVFETTHGDLEADELSAKYVQLETTHGDISADRIFSEEFDASTTHSDISIDELSGRSDIETTHGDVMIMLASDEDVSISTSHGDVDLYMSRAMGMDVDLRGQEVKIPASADFFGVLKEKMADGTINGGGARLEVSTSFGDVTLHPR